jgi:hypothetical protein
MTKAKVTRLTKGDLRGENLGTRFSGVAGRTAEQKLQDRGYKLSNGAGVDMPTERVEVKTRAKEATSPHTIATARAKVYINTDYENSLVFEKTQQQYRIKTQNGIVVENKIYDFSNPYVQDELKDAYNKCRKKLANGNRDNTIYGSRWGYLEKKKHTKESYSFRISNGAMKKIEAICNSTLSTLYTQE